VARLDFAKSAAELDRWIRGCDPQPGAWAQREGEVVRFYDARLGDPGTRSAAGTVVRVDDDGAVLIAAPGGTVRVGRVRVGRGEKQPAAEALRVGDVLS
jgi:methionyl-tRNA formyltransferase